MADEIIVKYQSDTKQAERDLDSYISKIDKVGKASQDSFLKGSEGAKRFERELNKTPKTLSELELKLSKLRELLRDDTKIGSEGFKKIRAEIEKTQKQIDGLNGKLGETKSASSNLISTFKNVAGAVGIAFGVQQIVSFGKEAIQLAAKAEGIETAFRKLDSPTLLEDLRKATRGTVTDLELMRQAVRAQNFQVPLDKLASFFEFATKRSIETGESVDYLVSSIIDGIGRKSTLVLDNLGISATQLQEEIKKTGDFGEAAANIISRSLEETGDVADTTAVKIAQLNVKLENTKTLIGEGLIASLEGAENAFKPFIEALTGTADGLEDVITKQTVLKFVSATTEAFIKVYLASWFHLAEMISSVGKVLSYVGEKLGLLNKELDNKDNVTGLSTAYGVLADESAKALEVLLKQGKQTKDVVKNISFYKEEIKKLTAAIDESSDRSSIIPLQDKIIEFEKEIARLLGIETEAQKEAAKATKERLKEAAKLLEDALKLDIEAPSTGRFFDDYIEEVERATSIADDLWNRHFQDLMNGQDEAFENDKKLREQAEQDTRDVFNTTIAAWQSLTQTAASLVQAQYDQQFASLDSALKKEQITREEYDRRKAQLGKEQAKKQKEFAITMAIINTALGVTNAFATAPNIILGAVLAAVVAAAGAAEIATIASQPVPQFAEGGWVDSKGKIHGRSHARGGVKIEAEGDEFITKGKYARSNSRLLEAINTGNSERYIYENHVAPIVESILSGGMGAMGDSFKLNSMFNDKNLLKQGDRNRKSERESARFIVDGITKGLNRKSKDRYV